jgi:ribose 5-phosphate isomerase B
VTGFASARELILAFLKAEFSGAERHLRRLQKIKKLENK